MFPAWGPLSALNESMVDWREPIDKGCAVRLRSRNGAKKAKYGRLCRPARPDVELREGGRPGSLLRRVERRIERDSLLPVALRVLKLAQLLV